MYRYANPKLFLDTTRPFEPLLWAVAMLLVAWGLYLALVDSPPDYQQGESVRIMYVHVPAAWMAMFIYCVIAVASAVSLIFRHPIADVAAKSAAPVTRYSRNDASACVAKACSSAAR